MFFRIPLWSNFSWFPEENEQDKSIYQGISTNLHENLAVNQAWTGFKEAYHYTALSVSQ